MPMAAVVTRASNLRRMLGSRSGTFVVARRARNIPKLGLGLVGNYGESKFWGEDLSGTPMWAS